MGKKYTAEQLNNCSKETLVTLFLSMQDQLEQLNKNMEMLIEQVADANRHRFGRSTEKLDVPENQLDIFDVFNEVEFLTQTTYVIEPDMDDIQPKRSAKKVGKREEDLRGLPVEIIPHKLPEDKLREIFPDGWKELPDEVYKRLHYVPATCTVEEHHVGVYAGRDNETIVKGDRPAEFIRNSIATPSLVAAIMNGKYVNALPLNRMEQEFKRNDLNIARQVMANWVITCSDRYLSFLYDRMHGKLFDYHVLQADETPVEVTKDGRPAGAKSYMWVYRTGKLYDRSIVLYEYQKTRNTDHPRKFLKGFDGVVVTDGYQVYHKLEAEEDLKVAGCWSHARRRYDEAIKSMKKEAVSSSVAYKALAMIAAIYKIENSLSKLTSEERKEQRQLVVKPLVEAYFVWAKSQVSTMSKGKTLSGLEYSINQEKYLKAFLDDGEIPMDNNAAEQSIRGFCVGKHNWHLIDSLDGAKASAVVYSIAETAKANNLKPYNYFEYLLEEIPKHYGEKNLSYLDDLLPWSEKLPADCHRTIE
jgi:transposase